MPFPKRKPKYGISKGSEFYEKIGKDQKAFKLVLKIAPLIVLAANVVLWITHPTIVNNDIGMFFLTVCIFSVFVSTLMFLIFDIIYTAIFILFVRDKVFKNDLPQDGYEAKYMDANKAFWIDTYLKSFRHAINLTIYFVSLYLNVKIWY